MVDQAMSVQQLRQLCIDLLQSLRGEPALAFTHEVQPFAGKRPNAIADRGVVIEYAADKDRAGAEHDHRCKDQLNRATNRLGAHETSSAVLKTVVKRRQ